MEWKESLNEQEYVQASRLCLDVLDTSNCPNLFFDQSTSLILWNQAEVWLREEWVPRAMARGLVSFARLVTPQLYKTLTHLDRETTILDLFRMKTFYVAEEAKPWIVEGANYAYV